MYKMEGEEGKWGDSGQWRRENSRISDRIYEEFSLKNQNIPKNRPFI
jgi:hypothetical protein